MLSTTRLVKAVVSVLWAATTRLGAVLTRFAARMGHLAKGMVAALETERDRGV